VLPVVLSWAAPDQPTPEQQRTAAYQFLEKMGWDKHQAMIIAHDDTEHRHVHILLNRVNPDNGLVLHESYSHRHAQAWALEYQREHGQEWLPTT
jgi:MobA/VirD2-like, nuclease domain